MHLLHNDEPRPCHRHGRGLGGGGGGKGARRRRGEAVEPGAQSSSLKYGILLV